MESFLQEKSSPQPPSPSSPFSPAQQLYCFSLLAEFWVSSQFCISYLGCLSQRVSSSFIHLQKEPEWEVRPGDVAVLPLNLPVFSECPQERDGHSKSQVCFWRELHEWTIHKAVGKMEGGQQDCAAPLGSGCGEPSPWGA